MSGRIMIAGTGSGSGKTSITCGLLGALKTRGRKVISYKCGPDYIDPLFHRQVLGIPSYNLDLFLSGKDGVLRTLNRSDGYDIAVIEGVMGYYDGLSGGDFFASSHHVSLTSGTPVILVVDCKGKSTSVAAELKGYLEFAPNLIKGVILNNVRKKSFSYYKNILDSYHDIEVLGYFPHMPEAVLADRQLGLSVEEDMSATSQKLALLAQQAEESLLIDRILELSLHTEPLASKAYKPRPLGEVNIAIARDKAFFFYYQDNLQLLEDLGARLIEFSPLVDTRLPDHTDGLIIGGGYLEEYAKKLSTNQALKDDIRLKISQGLPTIAEGGGYVYLTEGLKTESASYPMVGVISGKVAVSQSLDRFGYQTVIAQRDNLLCKAGESFNAHEFHYFTTENSGSDFTARKKGSDKSWQTIHASDSLFAGFAHLNFVGNEQLAERFISKTVDYKNY